MPPPARAGTASAGAARERRAIRGVAGFEAAKGLLVLLSGSGVLLLAHHDLHALAARLVAHLHLNPAAHMPLVFVEAAGRLGDLRLAWLAAGAAAYSAARLLEAWGLWHQRAWAEWLAAGSGAIYVPFEIAGLWRRPGALGAALLLLNLAVVALMLMALQRRRRS